MRLKTFRVGLVVSILTLLLGGSWFVFSKLKADNSSDETELGTLNVGEAEVLVEVKTKEEEKMQGLSGRESLPSNQGMLFVYEKSGFYSFWMKDMNFPIDIIWFNGEWEVVDLKGNISPDSFPQTFTSSKPAKYILETNAGFIQENNISVGDLASF